MVLTGLLISACMASTLVLFVLIIARPPRWSQMTASINSRPWSPGHVGLLIATVVCGFGAMSLAVHLASALGWRRWEPSSCWWLAVVAMFTSLPLLAMVLLMTRLERISPGDGFGIQLRHAFGRVASGVFLGMGTFPLTWLAAVSCLWLFQQLELQGDAQSAALMIRNAAESPWYVRTLVGALAVLLVPAIEELVFRGIAFPAAARKLGFLPAAIVVSLVFSVLHIEIATYAPLFVFSMALCLAYAHSGSILVPFAMHATFNLIQIALLPFVEL